MVDIDKNIDINQITPNARVALRNDSYTLHKILPNKASSDIQVTSSCQLLSLRVCLVLCSLRVGLLL